MSCLCCHVPNPLFACVHLSSRFCFLIFLLVTHVLCRLMAQGTALQEVDLGHNNLAEVSPDILAPGVNMIQVVKLYDTSLTRQQIERIIKHRGVTRLKTPDICFNAAIREVPRYLLQLAEQKIAEFSYLMH